MRAARFALWLTAAAVACWLVTAGLMWLALYPFRVLPRLIGA